MRDFYTTSGPMPLDQADGLRRLFASQAGGRRRVLPLMANPHVAFSGVVLDRLAAVLAAQGREVLVVDAGSRSPAPGEMALVELSLCVERLAPSVSYLPARGLPLAHVDTRGSASSLLDALAQAAPEADLVLLHAEASDLARVLGRRAARPVLLGADHPESVKHAYAGAKMLAGRCGLMTFDLLLATAPSCRRNPVIASSVADCLDGFLGAVLHRWAVVDPAGDPAAAADEALAGLIAAQLALDPGGSAHAHAQAHAHAGQAVPSWLPLPRAMPPIKNRQA